MTRAQLVKLADRVEHATGRLGLLKCKPKIIITYVRPSDDGPRPCERLVYEGDTIIERLIFEDDRWVPWAGHKIETKPAAQAEPGADGIAAPVPDPV